MDMFFADPNEIPLPPNEVRIRELRADVYPDGRRVRVYLETDPFQRRPNADLYILDAQGNELSSTSVIESMLRKMEMTMHLRRAVTGELTLEAVLFYARIEEPEDSGAPANTGEAGAPASGPEQAIERTVVDTARITFDIPA
jgi:hypothetical protein